MESQLVVSFELSKKITSCEKLMSIINVPPVFYWVEYLIKTPTLNKNPQAANITIASAPQIVHSKNILNNRFIFSPNMQEKNLLEIITPAFTYSELLRFIPDKINLTTDNNLELKFYSNHNSVFYKSKTGRREYAETSNTLQDAAALFLLKYASPCGIQVNSIN